MNMIKRWSTIVLVTFLFFTSQAMAAAYTGHVVVAKSGGNYTTISAAMAAITPTATNPFVIEVWPGTYTNVGAVKNYVHLKGSGANVTTIGHVSIDAQNITVSGFTITGGVEVFQSASNVLIENNVLTNSSSYGVFLNGGSAVIRNNTISGNFNNGILNGGGLAAVITGNTISGSINGIFNIYTSSATITDNTITDNGTGITQDGATSLIRDNNIYNNNRAGGGSFGGNYGIMVNYTTGSTTPSSTIKGNIITGNVSGGISTQTVGTSVISDNKITGNGTDVMIGTGTSTHASYNIYDTALVTGTKVGQYNLKSDGTPAP